MQQLFNAAADRSYFFSWFKSLVRLIASTIIPEPFGHGFKKKCNSMETTELQQLIAHINAASRESSGTLNCNGNEFIIINTRISWLREKEKLIEIHTNLDNNACFHSAKKIISTKSRFHQINARWAKNESNKCWIWCGTFSTPHFTVACMVRTTIDTRETDVCHLRARYTASQCN